MADWIRLGDVFLKLASLVGDGRAKHIILSRFHAGLLVAKVTRLVEEVDADIFAVDLKAFNKERKAKWAPERGEYRDYEFPDFKYSADDNVLSDKDRFPIWLSWSHSKAPADIWSAINENNSYRADWSAGEFATRFYYRVPFSEKDMGDYRDVVAAGVMLRADLVEIIPEYVHLATPSSDGSLNQGGRPASRHGDAIAAVTLRLAGLSPSELTAYTSAAVGEELRVEYARIGQAPPSERNRDTYGAGILRVLRARQT